MATHDPRSVSITQEGRSGSVQYREPGGRLDFFWEFGGGDTVAIVAVGTDEEWRVRHPWAAPRRAEILAFVGAEVVRQKAPSCRAELDEAQGALHLRAASSGALRATPVAREAVSGALGRRQAARTRAALGALGIAGLLAAAAWFKRSVLSIDPGPSAPIGLAVRTDAHVAILLRRLEAYTPSLHRDASKDRYQVSLLLAPLDGSAPAIVALGGGFEANALGLAKVLGSDGASLWYDVCGVGRVDLTTLQRRDAPAGAVPAGLRGAAAGPLPVRTEALLCAGHFVDGETWIGVHSEEEAVRDLAPGKHLRSVVDAGQGRAARGLYRVTVAASSDPRLRRILAVARFSDEVQQDGAFLRLDARSEALRVADPAGALLLARAGPELAATATLARIDGDGCVRWRVDTGIERLTLQQILPGAECTAFVGTRPRVPNEVSEPLLVLVDHARGALTVHSLARSR